MVEYVEHSEVSGGPDLGVLSNTVMVRTAARLVVPMQAHAVWRQVRTAQLAAWAAVAAADLARCPTWVAVRADTCRKLPTNT